MHYHEVWEDFLWQPYNTKHTRMKYGKTSLWLPYTTKHTMMKYGKTFLAATQY